MNYTLMCGISCKITRRELDILLCVAYVGPKVRWKTEIFINIELMPKKDTQSIFVPVNFKSLNHKRHGADDLYQSAYEMRFNYDDNGWQMALHPTM